MKKTLLIFLAWITHFGASAQMTITNPGFELYSTCPTSLGQVPLATGWFDVVADADYYNCGFTAHLAYPATTPLAASGKGFMGFASYGNPLGSAEAIGQHLSSPLVPGYIYTLSFASKKASSGTYSKDCGGVEVLGFKTPLTTAKAGVHTTAIPGAMSLAKTAMVSNTLWQTYTVIFTVPDTVRDLVFTVEKAPNCSVCLFLDDLKAESSQPQTSVATVWNDALHIYPNPSSGRVQVQSSWPVDMIVVTDIAGRIILHADQPGRDYSFSLDVSGVYLVSVVSGGEKITRRVLISK